MSLSVDTSQNTDLLRLIANSDSGLRQRCRDAVSALETAQKAVALRCAVDKLDKAVADAEVDRAAAANLLAEAQCRADAVINAAQARAQEMLDTAVRDAAAIVDQATGQKQEAEALTQRLNDAIAEGQSQQQVLMAELSQQLTAARTAQSDAESARKAAQLAKAKHDSARDKLNARLAAISAAATSDDEQG